MKIRVLVLLRMAIPRIPKFVLGWVRTSNYLLRIGKENIHHDKYDNGSDSSKHEFTFFFLKDVPIFYEINIKGYIQFFYENYIFFYILL